MNRFVWVLWCGDIGGAERAGALVVRQLRHDGHDASVLILTRGGELEELLRGWDVPYTCLALKRGSHALVRPHVVRRALLQACPDMVVTDSYGFIGLALRLSGYRNSLWGVDHGSILIRRRTSAGRLRLRLERTLARFAYSGEIYISSYVRSIAERFPSAQRALLIPNPVELPPPSEVAQPSGPLTFGCAARLIPGKGLDLAIMLVADLHRQGLDVRLRLAGDGPDRDALEALARELGVESHVVFVGWVIDIPAHWRECDVALALNDTCEESFCISVAEALASGRPVIASDFGAQRALVAHGETGFIVPAGDRDAARRAALELFDRTRLAAMSARARLSVAEFRPEIVAARFQELAQG